MSCPGGCGKRYKAAISRMMKCRIKDWQMFPLPWTVNYTFSTPKGAPINYSATGTKHGGGPAGVVRELRAFARQNQIVLSEADAWNVANDYWCAKWPDRCTGYTAKSQVATLPPRVLWGAQEWARIHSHGAFWMGPKLWVADIVRAQTRLDNEIEGCPHCSNNFKAFRQLYPENKVQSREQAAAWGWKAHEEASRDAGKPSLTYQMAAQQWDWPQMNDQQVADLLTGLHA